MYFLGFGNSLDAVSSKRINFWLDGLFRLLKIESLIDLSTVCFLEYTTEFLGFIPFCLFSAEYQLTEIKSIQNFLKVPRNFKGKFLVYNLF